MEGGGSRGSTRCWERKVGAGEAVSQCDDQAPGHDPRGQVRVAEWGGGALVAVWGPQPQAAVNEGGREVGRDPRRLRETPPAPGSPPPEDTGEDVCL